MPLILSIYIFRRWSCHILQCKHSKLVQYLDWVHSPQVRIRPALFESIKFSTCRVKLDIKVRDTQNVDSAKRLAGVKTSSILLWVVTCILFHYFFIINVYWSSVMLNYTISYQLYYNILYYIVWNYIFSSYII